MILPADPLSLPYLKTREKKLSAPESSSVELKTENQSTKGYTAITQHYKLPSKPQRLNPKRLRR